MTALDAALAPLVSAGYSYLADSALVENVGFTNGDTLRMTTTRQYDHLNRLTAISSSSSSSFWSSFNYAYNTANQRTAVTNEDNARWAYSYDALGQVTSGKRYWSDGAAVAGQQFDYSFDDIGNRKTTWRDTRQTVYGANNLNQLTARAMPGYLNVLGTAASAATVSLWSKDSTTLNTPTTRKSTYFRGEVPFNNSTGAVWLTITNVAVISNNIGPDFVTNAVGRSLQEKSPEGFTYDFDGNLTSDGLWTNYWDAENRLINQESLSATPLAAKRKLEFAYDPQGRRIQKIVSTNNGSVYVAQATNRFAYDGWNLLATLNLQLSTINSFAWGLDLSGSMQGAGGVGGLLAVNDVANGVHFCAHDGNGNVASLVRAADGSVSANYEYGPFGETIRTTGLMGKANAFRFSTKFTDDESGLLYYGYRSYNPSTGRWLSRDPSGEKGGANLYGFVSNDPIRIYDGLGLEGWSEVWRSKGSYFDWKATDLGKRSPTATALGETIPHLVVNVWTTPASCDPGFAQVRSRGDADVQFWWSISGEDQHNSYGHEWGHVTIHWGTFRATFDALAKITGSCMCEHKAECWRRFGIAFWEKEKAYDSFANDVYDCNNGDQKACGRLASEQADWSRQVETVARLELECRELR